MPITDKVHGKFQLTLASKATLQHSTIFPDSLSICFIVVELCLTDWNTPILKVWGIASWAQHPLSTGLVRLQFPSLRGTTRRNNGSSMQNGFRIEHHTRILVENTDIHEVKLKMWCYNSVCETTSAHQLLLMLVTQWPMLRQTFKIIKAYSHGISRSRAQTPFRL